MNLLWFVLGGFCLLSLAGVFFVALVLLLRQRRTSLEANRGEGGSGRNWVVWVAATGVISLLCLALAAAALVFLPKIQDLTGAEPGQQAATPLSQEIVEQVLTVTPFPSPTAVPTLTEPTPLPTDAAPTLAVSTASPQPEAAAQAVTQTYTDDFSSPTTGWPQIDDAVRMIGYSEGRMYAIALKQAGSDGDVLIPHGLKPPFTQATLSFRARPVDGKGYFGIMCNYIDPDNFLFIAITEGNYTIARVQNGEYTSYFDPFWVKDEFIKSEENEFQVVVSCGSAVDLMVNGYTLPTLQTPDLPAGDIGILASSNHNATLGYEFFYKVFFDDISLTVQ